MRADTSSVPRGVSFLDNILGRSVPPPKKNIPAIEPDMRSATTILAQLEKYRSVEMCMTCHNPIDPAGAPLIRRMVCMNTTLGICAEPLFSKAARRDHELTPYLNTLNDFRDQTSGSRKRSVKLSQKP